MMYRIVIALALAAAALWLVCIAGPDEPDTRPRAHEPAEQATPIDSTSTPVSTHFERPRHVERPRLPAPELDSISGQEVERVDFDRRPWDPTKEVRTRYEERMVAFEAFDRFRQRTGLSDERAQAILMLLYDFQEVTRLLDEELYRRMPFRTESQANYWIHKDVAEWATLRFYASEELESMLSTEEYDVWWDTVELIGIWNRLSSFTPLVPVERT